MSATRVYPRGPQPKIDDLETFGQFAQAHGHLTQQAMAVQWARQGGGRRLATGLSAKRSSALGSPVKKDLPLPRA
ncbi:MAG: hypothetical protein V2J55_03010 [Candidatus Competibacteraceae bacterium]|nr:hypothetical protein [Candidatus Competibacteraceae bacterium]